MKHKMIRSISSSNFSIDNFISLSFIFIYFFVRFRAVAVFSVAAGRAESSAKVTTEIIVVGKDIITSASGKLAFE